MSPKLWLVKAIFAFATVCTKASFTGATALLLHPYDHSYRSLFSALSACINHTCVWFSGLTLSLYTVTGAWQTTSVRQRGWFAGDCKCLYKGMNRYLHVGCEWILVVCCLATKTSHCKILPWNTRPSKKIHCRCKEDFSHKHTHSVDIRIPSAACWLESQHNSWTWS